MRTIVIRYIKENPHIKPLAKLSVFIYSKYMMIVQNVFILSILYFYWLLIEQLLTIWMNKGIYVASPFAWATLGIIQFNCQIFAIQIKLRIKFTIELYMTLWNIIILFECAYRTLHKNPNNTCFVNGILQARTTIFIQ